MAKCIIIDLDGTLCDTRHREHLAQEKRWDEFHALLDEDSVNEDVMLLMDVIAATTRTLTAGGTPVGQIEGYGIIILTARPERYRKQTLEWLAKFKIHFDVLMMRPDNDHSPSEIFKLKTLEAAWGGMPNWRQNILFALEDRDKTVEAFRQQGIPCWQVRKGVY